MRRSTLAAVAAGALLAGLVGCSDDDATGTGTGADTTDVGAAAATEPAAWTEFGFDAANSRFNPTETTITTENVGGLTERWHRDDLPGVSSTPMVAGGVAYFGDWDGVVHAVEADSGEERWRFDTGSVVMSSPTLTEDAVYVATNTEVVRLGRGDGSEVWRGTVSDHPLAIAPGSPVLADGLVVQSVASGELMVGGREDYTFRGTVVAFDAETGEEAWRRELTADDDETGAGVGIWSTPSFDEERGLLFLGTGNTYEAPASPLADSLVALDVATGEIAWSTQFTFPDVWSASGGDGLDADVGSGPNLWEADGRALVGAGDKRGDYHALDRDTGEVVWEADLTPGSILGGVIGTSAHAQGRIVVASNVGAGGDSNAPTGVAEVAALDDADGSVLWETEVEGAVYASVTAVPGLVFVASTSGVLHALDADTGDELWRFAAPEQSGSAPSVVDGRVYWGWGFALFGTGSGAGGLYAFDLGRDGDGAGDGEAADGTDEGTTPPGAEVYRLSCASCHGPDGEGSIGPALEGIAERLGAEEHERIVRQGLPGTQMTGFEDALTDEEIRDVVAYERGLG